MKRRNINGFVEKNVVLIADRVTKFGEISIGSKNLEMIPDFYFNDVFSALKKISKKVFVYDGPKEFIDNIKLHKSDVVISVWSGIGSKNRRTFVPSICESYGVCYVGADTYTHVLCQDKALAKEFCLKNSLNTPNYILIDCIEDIESLSLLNFPVVVKPNYEGGSIGISKDNLVSTFQEAIALCKRLYFLFKQSILVEEFVKGKEVSINLFGNSQEIIIHEAMETFLEGEIDGLTDALFSFEIKKRKDKKVSLRRITNEIDSSVLNSTAKVFKLLDKVDYMRFDGRLNDDGFHLIEMSPDASLKKYDDIHSAFLAQNIGYEGMFELMIKNSIKNFLSRNASTQ